MSAGRAYLLHGVRLGVLATGEGERAAAGIHSRLAGLPLGPRCTARRTT